MFAKIERKPDSHDGFIWTTQYATGSVTIALKTFMIDHYPVGDPLFLISPDMRRLVSDLTRHTREVNRHKARKHRAVFRRRKRGLS
jgi:hypothetical protein